MADSLYAAGCFNDAITEYKRYLFVFPDDENTTYIYHQLGLSYRQIGDWDDAVAMLRTAIDRQDDDSLRAELYLDAAVTNIAGGNYSNAELRLIRLMSFARQPSIRRDASFLFLIDNIYQSRWSLCRKLLDSASIFDDPRVQAEVKALLGPENTSRKSPAKAKWLSTFVPGLGQLYAGHAWETIDAIAINGFIGFSIYQQISSGANAADLLYWIFLFERYWSGNRNSAARLVKQDQSKADSLFRHQLLDSLSVLVK